MDSNFVNESDWSNRVELADSLPIKGHGLNVTDELVYTEIF